MKVLEDVNHLHTSGWFVEQAEAMARAHISLAFCSKLVFDLSNLRVFGVLVVSDFLCAASLAETTICRSSAFLAPFFGMLLHCT